MIRVTTEWTGTLPGVPYFSTHYFAGDTAGEADAAAAAVVSLWQEVDTVVSTGLTWTVPTEVEFVDEATGAITGVEAVAGGTGAGQNGSDPLPMATQGLLRWRTGVFVSGRELRGRTFIPGPTEPNNLLGVPDPNYKGVLGPAGVNFLTAAAGGGGLVVYSPTHAQAATVQSSSVWNKWSILRSRRD